MSAPRGARAQAVDVLQRVLYRGESLDRILPDADSLPVRDRALARALIYGVLRHYRRLKTRMDGLLDRGLKPRDRDIECLLLVGLFQIEQHRAPDYAVVSESVNLARALGKTWAKGLVNAVMRNALRGAPLQRAPDNPGVRYSLPDWMVDRLSQDWPEHAEVVFEAGQQPGPMTLRVNLHRTTRKQYLEELARAGLDARVVESIPTAVELDRACEVGELPGFGEGRVSVQDGAAQAAAGLLDPQPGDRVLDACAAPGGKTAHLFEYRPDIAGVVALDIDPARLERVRQNLDRCRIDADRYILKPADATDTTRWWDGEAFQRVLLDAPCTGSGVIRRHPDIKWLRRESDIDTLAGRQARLLDTLWPTVAPGGYLLYCTCSVFKAENSVQIERFTARTPDARPVPFPAALPEAVDGPAGAQILTGSLGRDGFYYALLQKAG